MSTKEKDTDWGTFKEKLFLTEMVQLRGKSLTLTEKKRQLRGYIRSCYKRKVWGKINRAECEKHAQNLLSQL